MHQARVECESSKQSKQSVSALSAVNSREVNELRALNARAIRVCLEGRFTLVSNRIRSRSQISCLVRPLHSSPTRRRRGVNMSQSSSAEADLLKLFDGLDRDHSGSISSAELLKAFAAKGLTEKDTRVRPRALQAIIAPSIILSPDSLAYLC